MLQHVLGSPKWRETPLCNKRSLRNGLILPQYIYFRDRLAQAVSRRPLTAEAWVGVQVNQYRICDVPSGTGTGFCSGSSVFPCHHHSIVFSILMYHLGDEQYSRWWPQFRDIGSSDQCDTTRAPTAISVWWKWQGK
jgi:hypothetical protein